MGNCLVYYDTRQISTFMAKMINQVIIIFLKLKIYKINTDIGQSNKHFAYFYNLKILLTTILYAKSIIGNVITTFVVVTSEKKKIIKINLRL